SSLRTNEVQETPAQILFLEAYRSLLPEFHALRAEELVAINLDIPAAVTRALGAAPKVAALKDRVVNELPRIDVERILRLTTYAMALSHAHTLFVLATRPPDELDALVEEGTALREVLFADANALVTRRVVNGNPLRDLKGPVGYKNLAVDLL